MTDPIMSIKSPEELESLLYGEKIDELIYQASRGNRRALAEVKGELGEDIDDRTWRDYGDPTGLGGFNNK